MPDNMALATDTGLAQRLAEIKEKNPHAYPRDYAAELGISEAQLTPVYYAGRAQELPSLSAVFESLAKLARVKLMARTSFAVFELFTRVDFHREGSALVLKSATCFTALNGDERGSVYFIAPASEKEKAAILIFDKAGAAALKVYIEAHEFDVALLKAATDAPTRHNTDIRELLEKNRALPESTAAEPTPRLLIEGAAAKGKVGFELVTAAIAVSMQHAPVKVVDARGWFNILDEDFNLHLKEEAVTKVTAGKTLRIENASGEAIDLWRIS
jgi:putative heme degradation protein